jgi:diguanylate cyclase (GGDEF)-like protein/PAS domain S-box-containing protein
VPRRRDSPPARRARPPDPRRDVAPDDLRAILNAVPAMIGYWDRDLRNRMANDAYVDFFGRTPEELHGTHIRDLLGSALFAENEPYMRRALAGEEQLFDRTIVDPSGAKRYTQASYIPDRVDEEVRGFFVLVTDVSARRRAELASAAAEQRFRTLFELAPLGTFLVSPESVVLDANPAAVALLGRPREAIVGRPSAEFIHPDDLEESLRRRAALLAGEVGAYRMEKRYIRGDGSVFWAQLDATLLRDRGDGPATVLGQIQDITVRREHEAELERLAVEDPLTGLLNRRGLLDELARTVARLRRYGGRGALLLLDLDRFKAVNDRLGHAAGDAVLVEVARLLRTRLRGSDAAGRLGGDEFAVVLPSARPQDAEEVADALSARIAAAQLGLAERPIAASVGIAVLDPTSAAADVLVAADAAMYRAKRAHHTAAGA